MKTIYLAGPIKDVNDYKRNHWRDEVTSLLKNKFKILNPMRRNQLDVNFNGFQEIVMLDKNDIDRSDIIVASVNPVSVGTSMEILYAWQKNKIILIVSDKKNLSPWMIYHSTKIFYSLDEMIKYINKHMEE